MTDIRNADQQELKALSELAKTCFTDSFGHLYSEEDLNSHLQKTCSIEYFEEAMLKDKILLAKNESKIIGYIKFGDVGLPVDNIPKKSVEIHRLYIHPKHKNMGIGKKLIRKAFESDILKSAKHIYLSVYENNFTAQNFYKKYGFSKVGEYDYFVGSHIDREFIFYLNNST